MDLEIAGRKALITGGSKGIGRAVAQVLAAEGCALHLAARSADELEHAQKEISGEFGVAVEIHPTDLGQPGAVEALAAACGGVDILVNNAGAIPAGGLDAIANDRWREAWDLKVFGYINLTRAIYQDMMARQQGVIVNVIGVAGEKPDAQYIAGTAGNASLMAFTRALGGSSPKDGIRVVAVNPGLISTGRMTTLLQTKAEHLYGDKERWREFTEGLPFGRAGLPEEVASAVAFLASPRASYISGTVITIDAGHSVRSG